MNTLNPTITVCGTFLIGWLGFLTCKKLKVPSAAVIGSLTVNALLTALGVPWSAYPGEVRFFMQSIVGMMLGSMIDRSKAPQMKTLLVPGLIVSVTMIILAGCVGFLLTRLADLDIITALYAVTPAAMSEVLSLSMDLDLDVSLISMFQIVRTFFVYLWAPFVGKALTKRYERMHPTDLGSVTTADAQKKSESTSGIILTVCIGFLGSGVFKALAIPGGSIIGAMTFVGAARLCSGKVAALPRKYCNIGFVLLGASAGLYFTETVVKSLSSYLGVALLFGVLFTLAGVLIAWIIHKWFKIDWLTSLLSCTTAGAAHMSGLAMDMRADAVTVGIIQSIRLIFVIFVMPALIGLLF